MTAPVLPTANPAAIPSWTARLSRGERLFAELAVARGLLRPETLEECARIALSSPGQVSLAETAVSLGLVTPGNEALNLLTELTREDALLPRIEPGQRFGEFRIIRELGCGGMGVVYEAEQESLTRRVALKVLPPAFAASEKAVLRFLREARAAGALAHPGIVQVYTSGQAQGVLFFAMELVDGPSLDSVIADDGPLAPERAARIAADCARALAHAHEHGLVHRDVKPSNIILGRDGRPRLTDFGLVREAGAETITVTAAILGTPAYMAPERARGNEGDERSDIYALGAVLYAMLAGANPYAGHSATAVLALAVTEPPASLRIVRPRLPADLRSIVARATARDANDRYQSAALLADDLERFLRGEAILPDPRRRLARRLLVRARKRSTLVAGALFAAGIAAALVGYALRGPAPGPTRMVVQQLTQVTRMAGRQLHPSISPDGRTVAFTSYASGSWDVWIKPIEKGVAPVNLTPDSPEYDGQPAFSPDGTQIAFRTGRDGGGLYTMRPDGSGLRRLTASGYHPAWSPDGRFIAYNSRPVWGPVLRDTLAELWLLDLTTGRTERAHAGDAAQPNWSPDGSRVVFWSQARNPDQGSLFSMPARGGEVTRLTSGPFWDWAPIWSPDGRQVFFTSNRGGASGIWSIAVDLQTGAALGEPEPLTISAQGESLYLSASADGSRLAVILWNMLQSMKVLELDPRSGRTIGVPRRVAHESTRIRFPTPSPDGSQLLHVTIDPYEDLVRARSDGSGEQVLFADKYRDRSPRWSPDGQRIAFQSDRSGTMEVWLVNPDGSGLRQVTHSPAAGCLFPAWAPDGVRLACSEDTGGTLIVRADREPQAQQPERLPPVPGSQTPFTAYSWSPDGRTIAGWSDGILLYDLQARSYTRLTTFGTTPLWLGSGPWIAFAHDKILYAVHARTQEIHPLVSEKPDEIGTHIGVTADGDRLYYTSIVSDGQVWVIDVASR